MTPVPVIRPAVARSARGLDLVVLIGLVLTITVILLPFTVQVGMQTLYPEHDHNRHLVFAQTWAAAGQLPMPHALYHAWLIGLHTLIGDADWRVSVGLSLLLPQVVLTVLGYGWFRHAVLTAARPRLARLVCALLALALVIVVPLFTVQLFNPVPMSGFYLIGFITPTTHHNPTQTLLRPVALAVFMAVSAYALGSNRRPLGQTLLITGGIAGLVLLTGMAKPSYLLVLLPALALWSAGRLIARRDLPFLQRIAWLPVIGVGATGALLLLVQYRLTFTADSEFGAAGIAFAPLALIQNYFQITPPIMVLFAAVSLLLPALIYGLHWRAARRDAPFNFAWLGLAFGAAAMYLLIETGERAGHGNFVWNAHSASFILYAAALRFALQQWVTRTHGVRVDRRLLITLGVTGIYVIHGLLYLLILTGWLSSFG